MLNDLKVLLSENKCENLTQCYGAYYEEGTIKIILELMDFGSLKRLVSIVKDLKE